MPLLNPEGSRRVPPGISLNVEPSGASTLGDKEAGTGPTVTNGSPRFAAMTVSFDGKTGLDPLG